MKKPNKKTIILAAAALAVLIGMIAGICALVNRRPKFFTPEQLGLKNAAVTLTADHGLTALAPANTTAAFSRAGEAGYDGVRFEVRRTADGIWVVLEEENIRGVTDGSGKIGKLTYKQLLQHRVDKGSGLKEFKSDPLTVPTLEQALTVCSRYGMAPMIEVKESGADCVEEIFGALGYRFKNSVCLVFTDSEQLLQAQELLESGTLKLKKENVQLCRLVERLNEKTLEEAQKTPDVTVCFPAGKATAKQAKHFTDAGLTLCAWGANKPKQIKALAEAGVSRFTTARMAHREIEKEAAEETTTAPARTRPATSKPTATKPAATKPTTTKPVTTTNPATTKSAATNPAATKAAQ